VPAIPTRVARFRIEHRQTGIGRRYNGWLHFGFTSLGSLAAIAVALAFVRRPSPAELLVVPGGFLLANLVEYFGHKGPMHRRKRGLSLLFRRHTEQHHRFFSHDAMAYESSRDFQMVLFPPVMLLFYLGAVATPFAIALRLVWSANAGLLFAATGTAYLLTYEWLHFAYHLDPRSWVGRLPLMETLRRHHTRHHDPALMSRYNFNITFPIADVIFGTRYRR
jgi:hypothetical protein